MSRVDLDDRAAIPAGDLAHGEKKRLELAMALAMRPALVLLDEPTAGMNAHETAAIAGIVRETRRRRRRRSSSSTTSTSCAASPTW